jgi:8-oxo-dGTP pyrophosphatase MutT (NUDIX family)
MINNSDFLKALKKYVLPIGEIANIEVDGFKPAAVLVPLVWEDDVWKLLYIHRADRGEFHRGEVAFPGGGQERRDKNLVETALRETHEELGITPEHVQLLGCLTSLTTISNYIVTPIVGMVDWPVKIKIARDEVTRFFTIPVDWLSDPANWDEKEIEVPSRGKVKAVIYSHFDGEVLWGLSARITHQLLHGEK